MTITETKRYCDRCGEECGNGICNNGFHIFRKHIIVRIKDDEYIDLCQRCYDSFAEWMRKERMTTLEKIREEIKNNVFYEEFDEYKQFPFVNFKIIEKILDKYASEECDNDCEHCAYLECPKEPCEDAVKYSKEQKEYCWDCEHAEMCSWYGTIGCEWKEEICEDAVSRQAVIDEVNKKFNEINIILENLPPVRPQEQTGHCKDCKYFEYDSVAKVDGVPLIVAHEICNKWGDGCKTKEDGYCFLFEPQERSDKE